MHGLRSNLISSNFPGGAYPSTPLACVCLCTHTNSSSPQSQMSSATIVMMVSLLSRSSVCFSACLRPMHQNGLTAPKISCRRIPPDPPLEWRTEGRPHSLLHLKTLSLPHPRWEAVLRSSPMARNDALANRHTVINVVI